MRKIKILLLSLILATGCSEEKRGKLTFDTNFESAYWGTNSSVIKSAEAHSGNYMSKINKDNPYSSTFEIKAKDLESKSISSVNITAWFMLTGDNSEQQLVFEIRDSSNLKTLEWLNLDATEYVEELNKWVKVEHLVDLTENNRNNPNNIYRVYASNSKDEPVYVDDIDIEFR